MRNIITPVRYFVFALAIAASCIVFWQTNRGTPLIDYSYQVENAYRIFQGQIPYRDFFLVVSPGTYYMMAFLMHLANGYSHMVQVYYVMLVAFCTILFTYGLLRLLNKDSVFTVVLLIPLLFSGQSIYPYPLYDPNVALSMLIALFVLFYIRKKKIIPGGWYIAAGMFAAIPTLFKQNTGAVFFLSILVVFVIATVLGKKKRDFHACILFVFGGVVVFGLFIVWLITHQALDQFIIQTLTFPSSAKNPMEVSQRIIQQYGDYGALMVQHTSNIIVFIGLLIGTVVFSRLFQQPIQKKIVTIVGHILIVLYSIFVFAQSYVVSDPQEFHYIYILAFWGTFTVISIVCCLGNALRNDSKNDVVYVLLPIILLASSNATFLSHGVVYSSYHMWPLAMILVAYITHYVERVIPTIQWKLVCGIPVFFLALLLQQAVAGNYSMYYLGTALVSRATNTQLAGLSVSGPWIQEFESMVSYVQQAIPIGDTVAFLPGEDPFFALTNRTNPLTFSLLHAGVYTLQPSAILSELLQKNVEWIVVKKNYQTPPWFWISNIDGILSHVRVYYTVTKTLPNYDIYKRNE